MDAKNSPSRPALFVRCSFLLAAVLFSAAPTLLAQTNPNSPTTQWTPILYANNNFPDPSGDQQTGSAESDIVGNQSQPSLYMQYNSSSLGFRLRVGADVNPPGFKGAAFIGLDANLDGKLDLFVGVDNSGSPNQIGLWNPGTGLNISPSTTTIANTASFTYTESSLNYSFTAVNATTDPNAVNFDLNADGKTDMFLTFFVPLANIVTALAANGINGFTASSPMTLVAATATQANSLNEDLNGVSGGINSSSSWQQLGAQSEIYAPNGIAPVPEPAMLSLFGVAGSIALLAARRRH